LWLLRIKLTNKTLKTRVTNKTLPEMENKQRNIWRYIIVGFLHEKSNSIL
jgi:hypothetical protein